MKGEDHPMRKYVYLWIILLSLASLATRAQYTLNGNAVKNSCNCYTLTNAANTQSGSVWNNTKIDLRQPFDFWFNVYLGCKDADGADGIVFMLQPISTSLGASGGGLGFAGVTPSVGILLDTWQNTEDNDPAFDHISIQTNGVIRHGSDLAGPVQASSINANIEDCQWHVLRISWDPVSQYIRSYFDGELRVEARSDLIANIFNNDPLVYWGFSAATGGSNNLQQFCTALNPVFSTSLGANNISCNLDPILFSSQSQSFGPIQSYYWNFGDGSSSTLPNPPPKTYSQPGIYEAKLVITGLDGCISDTLRKTITIGSKPVANFIVADTCAGDPPRITDLSSNSVGQINEWSWLLNGSVVSGVQQPQFFDLPAGSPEFGLVVKSVYGCLSDTIRKNALLHPVPTFNTITPDACLNQLVPLQANRTENASTISSWNWNFGDGGSGNVQNPSHAFNKVGNFTIKTWAVSDKGCVSDTVINTLRIIEARAFAGNDTILLKNVPGMLHGSGGATYSWSPATGLSDPNIANPVATLTDDQTYTLTVTTSEGCTDTDDIRITVFKGSAIYVPTGFTPNNDGLNDLIRPRYIGITSVDHFTIYNRWGQQVFFTRQLQEGWDGKIKGVLQPMGTYVWMLKATDAVGKEYQMKGSFILIR